MCRLHHRAFAENRLDPADILAEQCPSNSGKAHPNPFVIHRQQPSTPCRQRFAIMILNFSQVEDFYYPQTVTVHDHNLSIYAGEQDLLSQHNSIMWFLDGDLDTLPGTVQGDGVPLMEARHPNLAIQFEHEV